MKVKQLIAGGAIISLACTGIGVGVLATASGASASALVASSSASSASAGALPAQQIAARQSIATATVYKSVKPDSFIGGWLKAIANAFANVAVNVAKFVVNVFKGNYEVNVNGFQGDGGGIPDHPVKDGAVSADAQFNAG
jgi:hypothetical protein